MWGNIFKYSIGYMQQQGDQHEMGRHILNGGQGTTGPYGAGPVFTVRIRVYFRVQSEFV